MCKQCDGFETKVQIKHPAELKWLHNIAAEAVANEQLAIANGDLQWSDYIECDLRCTDCGAMFRLTCETYHGSGGTWSRVEND